MFNKCIWEGSDFFSLMAFTPLLLQKQEGRRAAQSSWAASGSHSSSVQWECRSKTISTVAELVTLQWLWGICHQSVLLHPVSAWLTKMRLSGHYTLQDEHLTLGTRVWFAGCHVMKDCPKWNCQGGNDSGFWSMWGVWRGFNCGPGFILPKHQEGPLNWGFWKLCGFCSS
jgi:hypothetical protein